MFLSDVCNPTYRQNRINYSWVQNKLYDKIIKIRILKIYNIGWYKCLKQYIYTYVYAMYIRYVYNKAIKLHITYISCVFHIYLYILYIHI